MAQDVIILVQEYPLQGPLEGVGPENQDFFGGPEMATSESSAILGPKIFRAHPFQWPE